MDADPKADERIEIPADFADHLADVFGLDDPPETVLEWWMFEGEALAESDWTLGAAEFYVADPTRHEVHVDGRVRYVACALDALAAAAMEARDAATARSVDPVTGVPVTVTFGDGSVDVAPGDAVISFGMASNPDLPEPGSYSSVIDCVVETDDDVFVDNVCEFQNAFESEQTYSRWAADADAKSFPIAAGKVAALLARLNRPD